MRNNLGTIGNYKWFLAQVATDQNQPVKDDYDARVMWGERVKIRIPGKHPKCAAQGVNDDNLPWAIIAKPTTCGNLNNVPSGIWGGEWVIGFFLDEGEQQPVITHVLHNNIHDHETTKSHCLQKVNRFNSGMKPNSNQIGKGSAPETPAVPDAKDFEKLDSKVDIENKKLELVKSDKFLPNIK